MKKMNSGAVMGRVMVRENVMEKPDAFDVIDAFINDEKIPGWKDADMQATMDTLSRPIEDSFMLAGLADMRSQNAAREAYVNQMSELISQNDRSMTNNREVDDYER